MKNPKALFNAKEILNNMEALRRASGAFIAAPSPDYSAVWIRDQLYTAFSYYYTGDYQAAADGLRLVFNIFHKHRHKLERVSYPEDLVHEFVHAKYNPDTLGEIAHHWGHHQIDALGLFLHIAADLDFKNIPVTRDEGDREILQLIVFYLNNVQYWHKPDFGMWEDCRIRHSSSIGAAVGGLAYIKRRGLAVVPDELIAKGRNELFRILPDESRDQCEHSHHRHTADMAQLSLIWPYNVVPREIADIIIKRIEKELVQQKGLNRYWGDDYYRSDSGVSGEWPMGFFWLSIVSSEHHDYKRAAEWFKQGCLTIIDSKIAEIYKNGIPNEHTPLAWAHAMALIAWSKLTDETRQAFLPESS